MATEPADAQPTDEGLQLDHLHTLVLVPVNPGRVGQPDGRVRALLFRGASEGGAGSAGRPPHVALRDRSGSRPVPVLEAAGWEVAGGPAVALLDFASEGLEEPLFVLSSLPGGECEFAFPTEWSQRLGRGRERA